MKNLAIVAIIVAVLALGTVMAINLTTNEDSIETEQTTTNTACEYQGGCTQEKSCGNPNCGIETTGSCGCR